MKNNFLYATLLYILTAYLPEHTIRANIDLLNKLITSDSGKQKASSVTNDYTLLLHELMGSQEIDTTPQPDDHASLEPWIMQLFTNQHHAYTQSNPTALSSEPQERTDTLSLFTISLQQYVRSKK